MTGCRERRRCVCRALPGVDVGDLCPDRRRAEAGRRTMTLTNAVGLVLAILVALLLGAALLVPEKF
ncbi:hypothetical protein I553_4156 [Mycobacterium xenopi 4042]|uniref:F subunit of K+-transporting ATPase family protein n=1 Tax=Mycobacterium xenopi 4042 TaxID=1299334 RepID=X8AD85_MYCXE|nr:hypothetical protein I553_4156 [Mycobacterium xenopi 4042]EUA50599.1 hypothetical protein I552_1537 [Mycobacterium xenopi 3993]